jgi:transcriptional regulator with XRE-family HTH domain
LKMIEKLDREMAKKNLTRADLARISGIPYTTIANLYLKGIENVRVSTLRSLAEALDVSMEYLGNDEYNGDSDINYTSLLAYLPPDLQKRSFITFLINPKNAPWLKMAQEAKESGFPLSLLLQLLRQHKG